MTREEAISVLQDKSHFDTSVYGYEAIDVAIEALQREEHLVELEAKAVAIIKSERHGEWQADKKSVGGMMYIKAMKCSKCNRTFTIRADWNYCPNCGAKMDKD